MSEAVLEERRVREAMKRLRTRDPRVLMLATGISTRRCAQILEALGSNLPWSQRDTEYLLTAPDIHDGID